MSDIIYTEQPIPPRKLPASPEAPDAAEPPGAGQLEADARISPGPVAKPVVAELKHDAQHQR